MMHDLRVVSSTERTAEETRRIPDSNYVSTLGAAHPAQPGADRLARVQMIRQARTKAKKVKAANLSKLYGAREQALYKENAARWESINPEWAQHGPELPLTSRGTPGRVVASQGAGLAGAGDSRYVAVPGYMGSMEDAAMAATVGVGVVGMALSLVVPVGIGYLVWKAAKKK